MHKIAANNAVYALSAAKKPVLEVEPGATVVFETMDCFSNQITDESQLFASVGWATINPATGPLAVQGARPGDTLVVEILDIETADQGVMVAVPDMGVFGKKLTHSETKVLPIRGGKAVFDDKLSLPLAPMIGVIGTAPPAETGAVPCGTPGPHGGNMDTRLIGKGARVYLPVFVEGALLSLGDLHAVMGDGEVVICGVEIAGQVTVRVDVAKTPFAGPVVETQEHWHFIASAETLDEAAEAAAHAALDVLAKALPIPVNHVGMLLSVVGNLAISQIVDPLRTARISVPKSVLTAYGAKLGA